VGATIKQVSKILAGMPTSDGAGVKLTRIIGSPEQNMFDPFLLLDVFESDQPADYLAGFPPHPHRGFETFTWLINGRMRHEDNSGNGGVIEGGGAQWMNAGRGIIHSEMPEQEDGLLKGVQLWINRPAHLKMSDPDYRDLTAADIPVEELPDGSKVRVMAGTTDADTAGPVTASPTEPLLLDISLVTGGTFSVTVPGAHNSFVWVADGDVLVGGTDVSAGCAALLGDGEIIEVVAPEAPARLLIASATQIGEPVARGGPFVMNTKAEILQAFADFESGALGGAYYIPGKS
jgi:redox-sensitive bicupin YhaK (pirin superfamily)